jgi:limonene-1,2-epoxide hydrolase
MAKINNASKEKEASDVVLSFINALNQEDFKSAGKYISENMTFLGVLGSRNGADAYLTDMEKMKFKYDIQKVFEDDEDVCLIYDIEMAGLHILTCGWYQLKNGKIDSIRVIFDPRPVLEAKK